MSTIPILFGDESPSESGTLGVLTPSADEMIQQVDAGKVKAALSGLSETMSEVFQDMKTIGNFKLKTVQFGVQISAEGGVALIANAKAGASGTITLTFSED